MPLLTAALLAEQRRLVLWVPVGMALGVLVYFLLLQEPGALWGVGLPAAGLALGLGVLVAGWLSLWARLAGGACVAMALGFVSAWSVAHRQTPMPELPRRAVVVSGTVQSVMVLPPRGADDATGTRRVVLAGARFATPLDHDMLPLRRTLSLTLRADDPAILVPGTVVQVRALLRPPPFPAFPGGRDFQREAWFAGSAGSGRALGMVQPVAHSDGPRSWFSFAALEPLRERIDARIRQILPGAAGTVASTVLTGEGASVPRDVREEFAASGLAHLLAVAGLHLGIVLGVLMATFRIGFSAWMWAALRWPCKELSALLALLGGAAYVALTGLHLPATRSLMMAAVVVLGLVAGRRAVSMRGLALAATVLLLVMPQEVLGVAFQMSFAAVMALIAGYEVARPHLTRFREKGRGVRRWLTLHLVTLTLTSLLAGLATLPVVMAHFGEIQPFFILANLIAVPLMAVWIMPLGLLALGLMPLHLDAVPLHLMGWGIQGVLHLAHSIAHWPAARMMVPHMPCWGLATVLLGLCWLCLWRPVWRLAGVVPILVGVLSPFLVTQPDLLISPDGGLMAVRDGRALLVGGQSRDAFLVRAAWQQALALPPQPFPAEGGETPDGALACGQDGVPDVCLLSLKGRSVLLRVRDRSDGEALLPDSLCAGMDLVISAAPLRQSCPGVRKLDRFTAWREGAQAIYLRPDAVRVVSDRDVRGARLWVMKPGGHGMPTLPLAPEE
ncbi:ComEC/Rec2 family competence protein [Acetobacter malorum]|uniref:Competence protein ComEC n=1 Tax=Acetobacter malorum TaxID=178901 RepID=A0A1Y3G7V3_9PROT|nr:ComEC/Rec2 family competence protein [Acetobacter malorum]OUJ07075.1 competence protein ComEC [Acetobacter malorum]